jgi:putative transposase
VFSLSLRDVELLLAEWGVVVSYNSVWRWCGKFGASFASSLRRRRPQPGDKWYLDEAFIRIQGELHYTLACGGSGRRLLDILVQARRDAKAAQRFFKRLLRGLQYVPRVIVTDKLRSYGAAKREVLPDVEHRQSRYLNNRAENSHRPTRRRERQMQRFKSPHQAQEFLFAHSLIYGHFRPRRHRIAACNHRQRGPQHSSLGCRCWRTSWRGDGLLAVLDEMEGDPDLDPDEGREQDDTDLEDAL